MISWIIDSYMKIDLLNQILLLVLIISLFFKGIGEITCWVICKNFNVDKTYTKRCIYLISGQTHDCKLLKYKKKYFKNEECSKEKCPGYRTSEFSIEEIKKISKFPFILLTTCKWISDLSAILLLIRTLFNTSI